MGDHSNSPHENNNYARRKRSGNQTEEESLKFYFCKTVPYQNTKSVFKKKRKSSTVPGQKWKIDCSSCYTGIIFNKHNYKTTAFDFQHTLTLTEIKIFSCWRNSMATTDIFWNIKLHQWMF